MRDSVSVALNTRKAFLAASDAKVVKSMEESFQRVTDLLFLVGLDRLRAERTAK